MSVQRRESGLREKSGRKRGSKNKGSSFDVPVNDSPFKMEPPFLDSADGLVSLKYYQEMEKKFSIALKEKDIVVDTLRKDIKVVEEENAKYKEKLLGLKEKFKDATKNIILAEEAYALLESKHKKLIEAHEELENRDKNSSQAANDALKKLKHVEDNLQSERSSMDKKLEDSWKLILSKDMEIEELKKNFKTAGESNLNIDSNNEALTYKKLLSEKNDHIKHLEEKLKDAVMEIEECSRTMLSLKSERSAANSVMAFPAENPGVGLQFKNEEKHLKHQLETLSHKLSLATERLRQFERNEYGLNEALAEIAEMKRQIRIRDMNIADLVRKVNTYAVNPEDVQENSSALPSIELSQSKKKRKRKKKHVFHRPNLGNHIMNAVLTSSKFPSNYFQEERNNKLIKWGKAVRIFCKSSHVFHKEMSKLSGLSLPKVVEGSPIKEYIAMHALEETTTQVSNDTSSVTSFFLSGKKDVGEHDKEGRLSSKYHGLARGESEILDGSSVKSGISDCRLESKCWNNLLDKHDHYHANERYFPADRLEDKSKPSKEENLPPKVESFYPSIDVAEKREPLPFAHSQFFLQKSELDVNLPEDSPESVLIVLSETLNLAKDISHVLDIVDEWQLDGNTSILLKEYFTNFRDRFFNVYQQFGVSYHHLMKKNSAPSVAIDFDDHPSINENENLMVPSETPVKEDISISKGEEIGCDYLPPTDVITVQTVESEISEIHWNKKCKKLENSIKNLMKEREKLQMYLQSAKLTVIQKEENIIKLNEISKQQIALLTQQVDESVPKSLYEEVSKQYNELIMKHRMFVQMNNFDIISEQLIKQQQQEINVLRNINERLEGELKTALQRLFVLEAALSKDESCGQDQNKISKLHGKVAELEAEKKLDKEKNRSAEELNEILKSQLLYMQGNVKELQSTLKSLEKQNHELQLKEIQLQDRFNTFLNICSQVNGVSLANNKYEGMEIRENNIKLKEVETVERRVESLQNIVSSKDAEIEMLRKQLMLLQNDDKILSVTTGGDLNHVQNIIAMCDDKIKFLEHEVENLNTDNVELKHTLLRKDVEKVNFKKIMVAYCSDLLLIILEMRRRYSGNVTLLNQERMYSSNLKLLTEFSEVKLYAKNLEEVLSSNIKEPSEEKTSSEIMNEERLLPCIVGRVKNLEEKLKKQEEYISKLEQESNAIEMQYEKNKRQWEHREYKLLKELRQLISPEFTMKDELGDSVLNVLPEKVEMSNIDDVKPSQSAKANEEGQQLQVALKKYDSLEKWKHDAEIIAQKNIIKELIEQLAKAEYQMNEMKREISDIRKELFASVSREAKMKSFERQQEKEYSVNLFKEAPMKDFSFAYKITMDALNVILNQKDAVLMRYKKQICDNREAQVDTLLEPKAKQTAAFLEISSEHKDRNGGQIQHQFILEKPIAISPKPNYASEPPVSEKVMELQNEISLQQRKCDYLAVQLNLWESEAQRYKALSEKRQLELEDVLNRHKNLQKSINPSCNYEVEIPKNDSFYTRKEMLMESVGRESTLVALESSTSNKMMVNVATNTDALSIAFHADSGTSNVTKEQTKDKEAFILVKGSVDNIDHELETLSNLINNAEEASDVRTEKELVLDSKHKITPKLKQGPGRKMNQSSLQIKIEKMKVEKLEELLHNCQLKLETVQSNGEKECKRKVELAKWEEKKKWQQTVDKLVGKLKSEKKLVQDTKKLNSNLRDAIVRLQREKTVLENKIHIFKKEKISLNPDSEMQVETLQKEILLCKRELFDLEKVNMSLKKQLAKHEAEKRKVQDKDREVKKDNTRDEGHRRLKRMSQSFEEVILEEKQEDLELKNDDVSNKINILEEEVKTLKEENKSLQERVDVFIEKEETFSLMHNEVNALRLELARKAQLLQAVKGLLKRIHEKTKKNTVQKEN
ncbi:centrosomal protein of 290 kDa-like isoform X2 [Ischnura elegans]|uniref:centrosomal protein of 290 kDa-like isoform X2 n=1 Tax=Ischnura elegans TaxID=197161 RepID=UPI001ED8988D|nr:centrosomal protein of 290 kDa-like isoform X2 [Ischnura elegans]